MRAKDNIHKIQKPVDHSLEGTSAWLRATAETAKEREAARDAMKGNKS